MMIVVRHIRWLLWCGWRRSAVGVVGRGEHRRVWLVAVLVVRGGWEGRGFEEGGSKAVGLGLG